jgi:hypothetical protein
MELYRLIVADERSAASFKDLIEGIGKGLRVKDSRGRQVNRHPAALVTFTVTSMPRKAPRGPE